MVLWPVLKVCTKLRVPKKWMYYYLYVVVDQFSRYVAGWTISTRERGPLARDFLNTCLERQKNRAVSTDPSSDRGAAMTSTSLALLLLSIGVSNSHCRRHTRRHTSNDNPFSDSRFKNHKVSRDIRSDITVCSTLLMSAIG